MTRLNPQELRFAVRTLLLSHDFDTLESVIKSTRPIDLSECLAEWPANEVAGLLKLMNGEVLAEVFEEFNHEYQDELVKNFDSADLLKLLRHLASDERVAIFIRMSQNDRTTLLPVLAQAEREEILMLSAYPDGTVGSMTSADYVHVGSQATVGEAWEQIKKGANSKEALSNIYVTDAKRHLQGVITLQDLLLSDNNELVEAIMCTDLIYLNANCEDKEAMHLIERYNLDALPVVDDLQCLLGIVTVDDAMELMKDSAADLISKVGGSAAMSGPELDYRESGFWRMFTVRGFWLAMLTLFGIVTSNFVADQEELLEQVIILAAFLAPIVDMGGNTGSQSATLVIRSMALGEVKLKWADFWFVMKKELPVALCLGLGIGALEVVMAFFFKEGVNWDILMVIGLSMTTVTFIGGLFGLALPFVAKRLNIDPATLSSPLLTSIMDLLGVVIYFAFAYAFLGDTLKSVV